jgi:hypothetical protein
LLKYIWNFILSKTLKVDRQAPLAIALALTWSIFVPCGILYPSGISSLVFIWLSYRVGYTDSFFSHFRDTGNNGHALCLITLLARHFSAPVTLAGQDCCARSTEYSDTSLVTHKHLFRIISEIDLLIGDSQSEPVCQVRMPLAMLVSSLFSLIVDVEVTNACTIQSATACFINLYIPPVLLQPGYLRPLLWSSANVAG